MADIYLRSTDGADADTGLTWALAKATLAGASAVDAAGDRIFVSQAHAETSVAAITFAGAGINSNPVQLLCGNDAAEPPTALAITASITTTNAITINGALYAYGITFISGSAIALNNDDTSRDQTYEGCSFQITNTGSAGQFFLNGTGNALLSNHLLNCTFKQAGASNLIVLYGNVRINGGSFVSGTVSPTVLFSMPIDRTASYSVTTGLDLTNLAATVNIFAAGASSGMHVIRNCKLPAAWSGSLLSAGVVGKGVRFEMHNCDSANTNYRLWVEDYAGSTKSETTVVRTSGASDGTTPLAWKMVTSANSRYRSSTLESPEIVVWNDTAGAAKTITVEFVHDTNVVGGQGAGAAFAFQNDEVWLEAFFLGNTLFPLATFISSSKATVLAAAANIASSSVAWTTTGLTTPVKQSLSMTFTPQQKGFIICRVVMAKAAKTIYVDPLVTVA